MISRSDFEFDIDDIPALSERRRLIYANVTNAVAQGIITRNEARERLGLSPVEGGNELYISANLFPLGSEPLPPPDNEKDFEDFDELDDEFKNETKATDFPKRGDDKKISLRNSNYPQFDYDFALNVKEDGGSVGKDIWKAGGNIRGNEAFNLWGRAREGDESPAVLKWIKEREAWAARHSVNDGNQFVGGDLEPNLSNVSGVVALMKWGVINPKLKAQGMKDVILELTKKLEGRKEPDEKIKPLESDSHIAIEVEEKQVSAKVKEALKNKVDEHNEEFGDNKTKRVTLGMLEKVFLRGVGAFKTNPSSVRPGVRRQGGADRWAFARTNSFLFALRTGRFQGGKHDTDLFPEGHPLKSKGPTDSQGRPKK